MSSPWANNNNVNRKFCMTIKPSFRFEGINKVYSDFSLWQILSFVGPWNTIVEAAVEVRSIKNTACVENNGVGENILEHNLLSAKKCGKVLKSVWKFQIFKEQSNSSHHCCPYYYNDIDVYITYSKEPKSVPPFDLFTFFRVHLIQSEASWKLSSTSDWLMSTWKNVN